MTDHQAILATLDEYADAYCAKDLERLMAVFVDGHAISLIGTGGDELCSGRSAVSSVFERISETQRQQGLNGDGKILLFMVKRQQSRLHWSFT